MWLTPTQAKEALLSFEKRNEKVEDSNIRALAATNLCFVYFLEGDLKNAVGWGQGGCDE